MDRAFEIGGLVFTFGEAALAGAALLAAVIVLVLLIAWRRAVAPI